MKAISISKLIVMVSILPFLFGCQKESLLSPKPSDQNVLDAASTAKLKPHEYSIKGDYNLWYSISLVNPPNPGPAFYSGGGEGNMNHLGNSNMFYNQLAISPGVTVPRPVNLFYAAQLQEIGIIVPDDVSIIFFDKQANSIWIKGNGPILYNQINPARNETSFEGEIIGGTGKFNKACGHVFLTAYFNPTDMEDAGMNVTDGTIVY